MTASHNIPAEGSSNVEGLPKSFVCSMRTLFDIMDDQQTGYIRFSEIERRWHEDGTQGLPEGVLSNLRKVTPSNGFLSFDRFCAGLKMCLLKSKGRDDTSVPALLNSIHSASLSSTNSLEVIPPLKASSPQTSPHNKKTRPLSAPLLDQDIYFSQPLANGNFYSETNGSRRLQEKGFHFQNEFANNHYKHRSSSHNQPANNSNIYSTKSDIRVGVGGIKSLGKCPPLNTYHAPSSSTSSTSSGPPKPPRSQETEPMLQRSVMPSRMTNSLERESRSEKRWSRERDSSSNDPSARKDRGGSLERLLDAEEHKFQGDSNYGPPLNRTGMRSALQTWFKERSKSDLQKLNKENRDRNGIINRFKGNNHKEQRVPPSYQVALETSYRGNADGSNQNRNSVGVKASYIGRNAPLASQSSTSNVRIPPPPSQHVLYNNGVNSNYDKIYGKTMETVVAVPTTYIPNAHGERIDSTSTNGPTAHGLYVAPQPPQLAVHKKTSKKKEPRRHTLQNGVDQNVMKRLRQLEAERDMLYQGLDVVERAKVWYKMQLQNISERIHYLPFGQTNSQEPSLESQQEKLHFQLARIHEINAHLRALMDAQEKGLPAHMNLAIRGSFNSYENDSEKQKALDRLKQQNKLLTEEVSGKSERITNLEREKAALLRELFQARAAHRPANADSTFM